MKDLWQRPAVRFALIVAGVAALVWMVIALKGVVTPFAVAFALAYFLNPPVNALERGLVRILPRRRGQPILHPRSAAVGMLLLVVAGVLALVFAVGVPAAFHQATEAVAKLPEDVESLRTKLEPKLQRFGEKYPVQAAAVRDQLEIFMKENVGSIVERTTHLVQATLLRIVSMAAGAFDLLVMPIFAAYLLYDMNQIRNGGRDLVPMRYREYAYSRMREVDVRLSAFVRGQLTVCLIMVVFYGIVLSLFEVPLGLLVGVLIGLCHVVPFVASVVGLPLTALLALVESQSVGHAMTVVAVVALGQFLEANVISPRIVGHGVGLHAVVIILAVLVGAELFGFIGMLVAVPLTAALSVFWADLRELYLASEFYRGDPPPAPPPV
jgi:predicted PurR-regulated permease PerM